MKRLAVICVVVGLLAPPAQAAWSWHRHTVHARASHLIKWHTEERFPTSALMDTRASVNGHPLQWTEGQSSCDLRMYGRGAIVRVWSCKNGPLHFTVTADHRTAVVLKWKRLH